MHVAVGKLDDGFVVSMVISCGKNKEFGRVLLSKYLVEGFSSVKLEAKLGEPRFQVEQHSIARGKMGDIAISQHEE